MSFTLPSFSFLILTKNVSAFLKAEFFPRYYLLSNNMTWRGNKEQMKHSCPIDQNTIPLNPRKVMRGEKGSHINSKIRWETDLSCTEENNQQKERTALELTENMLRKGELETHTGHNEGTYPLQSVTSQEQGWTRNKQMPPNSF